MLSHRLLVFWNYDSPSLYDLLVFSALLAGWPPQPCYLPQDQGEPRVGGGEEEALATVESEAYLPWLAGWQTPTGTRLFFAAMHLHIPSGGTSRTRTYT